jgi:hypothetical protein
MSENNNQDDKKEEIDEIDNNLSNENKENEKKEDLNLEEISTNKSTSNNNDNKENSLIEPEIDPNTYCHRILYKGSNIDISQYELFPFIKVKEKGSLLSNLGFKNPKILRNPYFALLNETFIYMIKDKVYDKSKINIRRIGNKYSLFNCQNVGIQHENEFIILHIEFLVSENDYAIKELYFKKENGEKFMIKFENLLVKLGIINYSNEENEDEDNKNEEQDNEQDEKEDEKEDKKENENQEEGNIEKIHKKKKKSKKKKEPDEEELK